MNKKLIFFIGCFILLLLIVLVSAYIYITDSFGVTYTQSDGGATWERGEAISLKVDGVNQIVVNFKETATPNRSRLWSGNKTLLYTWKINGTSKNATFTADTGSFPQGVYYVAFDKHGGSYNGVYQDGGASYPVVRTNINYLKAFYTNGVIPISNTTTETYFIMNITTRNGTADSTPPYFTTIPETAILNYSKSLGVLFVAEDDISAISNFSVNSTNLFQINNSGWLSNKTDKLPVGFYNLNVSVRNEVNLQNSTLYSVNVTKSFPNMSYYMNSEQNNLSLIEPQQINVSVYTDGGTIFIYRDGDDVTLENGQNVSLPPGKYIYKFNITGNSNYTDASSEFMEVRIRQQRYYQLIWADSIQEESFNNGNVSIKKLTNNLWIINSSHSVIAYDKARADIMKVLYRPTNKTNASTANIIQNITGLTSIYSSDGRDRDKRLFYSYLEAYYSTPPGATYANLTCYFGNISSNFNVSSWIYNKHANGISSDFYLPNGTLINRALATSINDTFGKNTSKFDYNNPLSFTFLQDNTDGEGSGTQYGIITSNSNLNCSYFESNPIENIVYWFDFFLNGNISAMDYIERNITLEKPIPDYNSPSFISNFNCSVILQNTNLSHYGNISLLENSTGTWKINQTKDVSGFLNSTEFSLSFNPALSNILWTCRYCDLDDGCMDSSENRTLIFGAPSITKYLPVSQTSRAINVSATFNITGGQNLSNCYFNITRGASSEIANTDMGCNGTTISVYFNKNYSVSSEADYVINIWANSTANIISNLSDAFSISLPPAGPAGPGGGGGGGITYIIQNETIISKERVCKKFEDRYNELVEQTLGKTLIDRIIAGWRTILDLAFCKSMASVYPID